MAALEDQHKYHRVFLHLTGHSNLKQTYLDVERNHRHHPVRRDGPGVRGPEVRSPDERVDPVG